MPKAEAAAGATGLPAIADDSGIEAAALGGAPGVRSARFAGEGATDEQNLAKLLRDVPVDGDRRVSYVCALAYATAAGDRHLVEGRCDGHLALRPTGTRGFGYDPAFVPVDIPDGRTMAELSAGREGRDQPSRPGGARHAGLARALGAISVTRPLVREGVVGPATQAPRKTRVAAVSILSNSVLIVLKVLAGLATGSIAILTEAVHSAIDLVASMVAYVSVRKADEPADESHMYGHAKVENMAAVIEGMLILLGAAVIVYESARRLVEGAEVEALWLGIAVVALSTVTNAAVSTYLYAGARRTDSPALEGDAAHLRTDALTSAGVLVGLVLVEVTGIVELDAVTALVVAGAIVYAGIRILDRSSRVLVDEALPDPELQAIRTAVDEHDAPEVTGFHKLRARRAGSRRYIDLHVQFAPGTTLERAHEVSHELQRQITSRVRGADVLIHLEPDESLVPADGARARVALVPARRVGLRRRRLVRPLHEVDRGRGADREEHSEVADVVVHEQQDGRDQADHGGE